MHKHRVEQKIGEEKSSPEIYERNLFPNLSLEEKTHIHSNRSKVNCNSRFRASASIAAASVYIKARKLILNFFPTRSAREYVHSSTLGCSFSSLAARISRFFFSLDTWSPCNRESLAHTHLPNASTHARAWECSADSLTFTTLSWKANICETQSKQTVRLVYAAGGLFSAWYKHNRINQ